MRITRAGTDAADCHGFLCGHICVSEFPEREIWQEYLDLQSEDEMLVNGCIEDIDALVSETQKSFNSPEFEFNLMLPDEESPLKERVGALSEWCHGFLNGFALGEDPGRVLEDETSRELIENFTRICRVEAGEQADEGDERALVELVEYVRMGAIYIFDRVQAGYGGGGGQDTYH